MDLPEIYDTLRKDVTNYADGIDPSQRKLFTQWEDTDGINGTDSYKVDINDQGLAEDLDEYKDALEQYNLITETAVRLASENAPEYLNEEWHNTSTDTVTLSTRSGHVKFLDDETVHINRWVRANQDPIVEADSAEELRENLYEAATETGHGPVYEALDQVDADATEEWHDQLWDLVTDDLEEHNGERYSVQGLLEGRAEIASELTEQATDLEDRLTTNLRDALREYQPSTGTRIRRSVRKLL